ncbi:MAG: HTH-type transcriptional regulator BhcR [Aestuariivirgaceae bacterium]
MAEEITYKRSRGRPRSVSGDGQGATVLALDRGLMLLSALARNDRNTLTELALQVGMPPSTAHRLLVTLQKHGLVEFDEATQDWMVGVEAFRIGSSFVQRTNLVDAGRKVMRSLMEETGETANLAIADDGDVVFVNQIETHNPIRAFFGPGTRSPMHASGIGKALLAQMPRKDVEAVLQKKGLSGFTANTITSPDALFRDLEKTRERGWSFDDEERQPGMRCIAAPIFNAYGEAIAGISISGPSVRFPDHVIDELGPKVRRAAAEVTQLLGGSRN